MDILIFFFCHILSCSACKSAATFVCCFTFVVEIFVCLSVYNFSNWMFVTCDFSVWTLSFLILKSLYMLARHLQSKVFLFFSFPFFFQSVCNLCQFIIFHFEVRVCLMSVLCLSLICLTSVLCFNNVNRKSVICCKTFILLVNKDDTCTHFLLYWSCHIPSFSYTPGGAGRLQTLVLWCEWENWNCCPHWGADNR